MSARTAGVCTMTIAGVVRPVRGYVRLMPQTTDKQPNYGLSGYQGYTEVPVPATAEVSSTDLGGDSGAFEASLTALGTNGRKDNVSFTMANGDQHILQNAHLQGQSNYDASSGEITFTLFGENIEVV